MLKRLMVLTITFVLIASAGLLVGCGQKGSLYLPASEPVSEPAPVETPAEPKAPAEQTITK